jgi:hypothetical protein
MLAGIDPRPQNTDVLWQSGEVYPLHPPAGPENKPDAVSPDAEPSSTPESGMPAAADSD